MSLNAPYGARGLLTRLLEPSTESLESSLNAFWRSVLSDGATPYGEYVPHNVLMHLLALGAF